MPPANLDWRPDLVVVGNVHGKDHLEVAAAQRTRPHADLVPRRCSATSSCRRQAPRSSVAGTHGKTTTTSLLAPHPGRGRPRPVAVRRRRPGRARPRLAPRHGSDFVIEGDEYDTAFFDKGSKFLHYRPNAAILTSIELDHVDIFPSFDAVRDTFKKLVALMPPAAEAARSSCAPTSPDAVARRQGVRAARSSTTPWSAARPGPMARTATAGRLDDIAWWAAQPRGRQERPRRVRRLSQAAAKRDRAVRDAAGRAPQRRQLRRRDRGGARARRGDQGHPARRGELRRRPPAPGAARHRRRRHRARRLRAPPDGRARDPEGAAQAVPQAPADRGLRAALGDEPAQDVPGRVRRCVRARRRGDRRQAVRSDEDPRPTIASIPRSSRSTCTAAAPRPPTCPRSTRSSSSSRESAAPGDVVVRAVVGQLRRSPRQAARRDRRRDAARRSAATWPACARSSRRSTSPTRLRATTSSPSFFVLRNETRHRRLRRARGLSATTPCCARSRSIPSSAAPATAGCSPTWRSARRAGAACAASTC